VDAGGKRKPPPLRTRENQEEEDKRRSEEYAVLSKAAYSFSGKKNDRNSAASVRGVLDSQGGGGGVASRYTVDTSLSDHDHVTFVDGSSGRAVVAYRGTDKTNVSDLFTDAAIFLGVQDHTKRFKRAAEVARKAVDKYGEENVHATGHSLGGSQALYATRVTGMPSYAYNPGRSLDLVNKAAVPFQLDLGLDILDSEARKNAAAENKESKRNRRRTDSHAYVTGMDPVSAGQWLHPEEAMVHFVPPKSVDIHGLDNFL